MKVKISSEIGENAFEMDSNGIIQLFQTALRLQTESEQSEEKTHEPENTYRPTERKEYRTYEDGYKGFLIVQCRKCGELHGFCAKKPTLEYRCKCGEITKLSHMKNAFVQCKCGGNYRYKTNVTDRMFTFNCLGCGSPVDLAYNEKKGCYQSM